MDLQNLLDPDVRELLHKGTVIPAHPLALDEQRLLDEGRQRRLTRYYLNSGAGGIAVGVHTTQFQIRDTAVGLYEKVIALASEEVEAAGLDRPFIKVAGICGDTRQALEEAAIAVKYGYHLGLVSLGGLRGWTEDEMIKHIKTIAALIPVFGFYLQPAVGGRVFSYDFWEGFAAIKNVHAIKVAAFNRYQTLDVMRAVCFSDRCDDIAMYTGNDDNIVVDLLTQFRFTVKGQVRAKNFVGGLLGHWAVWTNCAVELLAEIKHCRDHHYAGSRKLLTKGVAVTDMNAVIFDPVNDFKGCIPGIHEVLRRQGLLEGNWCLDPHEQLSKGQLEEINRVYLHYPELTDDAAVKTFLSRDQVSYPV
jgi:hypothetical protein